MYIKVYLVSHFTQDNMSTMLVGLLLTLCVVGSVQGACLHTTPRVERCMGGCGQSELDGGVTCRCNKEPTSCAGRCGDVLDPGKSCQCNEHCDRFDDCCHDYEEICLEEPASCAGRCGDVLDPGKSCQCNEHCERFNDCCHDYEDICLESPASCLGRCGNVEDPDKSCQCNEHCDRFDDCCEDYHELCDTSSPPSDTVLKLLTEELWAMDDNRLPKSDIQVDKTGNRFITYVDETHFSKQTFSTFIKLMDNYIATIGVPEPNPCAVCTEEEEDFLSAILKTRLMQRTWLFLSQRGYASSDEAEFKRELSQYWFDKYTRSGGPLDSSGFEHVFLGELKATQVSGFHNWIQFYTQQEDNTLNYDRYINGCQPSTHMTSFEWEDRYKSMSSLFVGTSPEFEMAVYTVCFLTRRNEECRISLNDYEQSIVTYTMSGISPVTVGTAYPDCL